MGGSAVTVGYETIVRPTLLWQTKASVSVTLTGIAVNQHQRKTIRQNGVAGEVKRRRSVR
jgi:hypothetical protein